MAAARSAGGGLRALQRSWRCDAERIGRHRQRPCRSYRHAKLAQDARFAALAIESGSEWIMTDRDYVRFPAAYLAQSVLIYEPATTIQPDIQSSRRRPSIRENSLVLCVTRVKSSARAWAPIKVSRGPMGFPFASSDARTLP